jgi:riboflavin synthase alpha subunit
MPGNHDDLFCFFSGFAHQDIVVNDYQEDLMNETVILTCHNIGTQSLSKEDYIQLDGVLFQILETNGSHFSAISTFELVNNTSIKNISPGSKITLGILAEKDISHDRLWTLQPSALSQVTYLNCSVLAGHEHTLKLDFEAPLDLAPIIHQDAHLGLAGCSLTAREVSTTSHVLKFSIYCGRETRENSQFNQNLQRGTRVNLTEPAVIADRSLGSFG